MRDDGAIRLERVNGAAGVALSRRAGAVRLDRLEQRGSAKAFLPRIHGPVPEVVFLNTAGGLTGGDRLAYALDIGGDGAITGTTQTAERIYSSRGEAAEVTVTLRAGTGARLHWLPQETILFDGAVLTRRTEADLAPDGELLLAETLVFGRAAMGEEVRRLELFDRREVRRAGRPVFLEPLRLNGTTRDGLALLNGARAIATLALVAPGAEDALGPVRAVLETTEKVEAAASAWDGRCIVRLAAGAAWPLRQAVARVIGTLRGAPLPRVWQM